MHRRMVDDDESEDEEEEAAGDAADPAEEDDGAAGSGSKPLLRVFWGSQTGTAQRFASKLVKEARRHGFRGKSIDLEGWNPANFARGEDGAGAGASEGAGPPLSLFLMATYGEGDPTANAEGFMEWLEEQGSDGGAGAAAAAGSGDGRDGGKGSGALRGLRFGVFGLGNKTYDHYNAIGKQTNQGLEQGGAERVVPYGEGDDDDNINEDFAQWRQQLWPALRKAAGLAEESTGGSGDGSTGGSAGDGLPEAADLSMQLRMVPEPEALRRKGEAFAAAARRDPSLLQGFSSVKEEEAQTTAGPSWARAAAGDATAASGGDLKHAGKSYGVSKAVPRGLADQGKAASMESEPYFTAVPVRVIANRELRQKPQPDASTFHVELDLRGSGLAYETADNLSVLPQNPDSVVEPLCAWLGGEFEDPDAWFVLEPRERGGAGGDEEEQPEPLFPTPTTVRAALSWYVDLQATPSREFVGQLARWATKPEDRARLAFFSKPEGRGEWQEWAVQPRRSLVEVLQEFSSVKPPLGAFLELAPRLKPRQYTIASSSVAHPRRIHLAVSIVREPKEARDPTREHMGVCTHYMQGVRPHRTEDGVVVGPAATGAGTGTGAADQTGPWPTMRVFVTTSHFELPPDPRLPVVLVGPGTGIAPMRAFLQERAIQRERLGADAVGETVLFFGCRRRDEDYIYREEIEGWKEDGTISELVLAFSREQRGGGKVYVQDRLLEDAWQARVWDMIHGKGGSFYVCGARRMGHAVVSALAQIAQRHGGMDNSEAASFVDRLEKTRRLVQELW